MEITKDKITEIFCIIDEFCQEYDKEIARMSICEPDGRKHRNHKWTMSRSEIMTILICFHFNTFRNFKHYYLFYVKFPKQLSYNRFVELESRVAVEMMLFLQLDGYVTMVTQRFSTLLYIYQRKKPQSLS